MEVPKEPWGREARKGPQEMEGTTKPFSSMVRCQEKTSPGNADSEGDSGVPYASLGVCESVQE